MGRAKKPSVKTIMLLSGSTGRTVEEVLKAALAQFEDPQATIVRRVHTRTAARALKAVEEAASKKALLLHSLVAPDIRQAVVRHAQELEVPTVDVLGPALSALNDHLKQTPRLRPGLSYQLHKEHFDRIDAVNFTLRHDDGCQTETLHEADIVLVGPSRVAKSATCFYLAYHGVRAANVPLVSGWDLPNTLLDLDKNKVIALTMNATRLQSLRRERMKSMKNAGGLDAYTEMKTIRNELRAMEAIITQHGWHTIDVSYMSIEEVARDALASVDREL